MNVFFISSFLNPDFHLDKLQQSFFNYSFLSVRKESKEACTLKELLEFLSVALKRINSPDESGSDTIRFLTLHYVKFFNAILLMCEGERQRKRKKE